MMLIFEFIYCDCALKPMAKPLKEIQQVKVVGRMMEIIKMVVLNAYFQDVETTNVDHESAAKPMQMVHKMKAMAIMKMDRSQDLAETDASIVSQEYLDPIRFVLNRFSHSFYRDQYKYSIDQLFFFYDSLLGWWTRSSKHCH